MGGWINPDRLPSEALSRLRMTLPHSMPDDLRSKLLRATSEAVDMWEKEKSADPLPHSELVDRIERLELAAKAFQRAIENLKGDPFDVMAPHFDYLIWGTTPPVRLPDELRAQKLELGPILEDTWSTCQTLRDTGAYTRDQIRVDRTVRPSMQSANALAYKVITAYAGIFRERPPTYKGAWFVGYMENLADILMIDVKFGFTMLTTVAARVHSF